MLKTTFAKTFYLCNSLLLVTTSFSPNPKASGIPAISREKETRIAVEARVFKMPVKHLKSRELGFAAREGKNHFDQPRFTLNKKGMLYVKKYIHRENDCLVNVKKRSQIPFNIIDSVFTQYGLPVELKYLAVIESELKPSATSHVGAKGPWQFMPETAEILGLKVNRQCDERSNYYKSTIAAAKYLRDLYGLFDDWLLVLAAYNGGPKPVYNAIRESGSRNFWVLQNYLPAESREHVKKFIATHYYFEGRGSETTWTRAENAGFKKKVKSIAKTLKAPHVFDRNLTRSFVVLEAQNGKMQESIFSVNQLFSWQDIFLGNHPSNSAIDKMQSESPEEKFNRLMKESEESLKNSRKVI